MWESSSFNIAPCPSANDRGFLFPYKTEYDDGLKLAYNKVVDWGSCLERTVDGRLCVMGNREFYAF
jgi:hypothetical protein